MKNLSVIFFLLCLSARQIYAAFPFYEPFASATAFGGSAYTVGSKIAGQTNANGSTVVWADNNTGAVDVAPTNAAGNLSYSGLPASSGNMSYFTNVTARTTRVTLPSTITTGTAYYSYKIQLTSIANLSAAGAYLNGFSAGTGNSATSITTLGARLWAKKIDADHFVLGISKNTASVTAEVVFDTTQYTTNDVLFIVAGYTFSGVALNDTASLWINPGSLGAASAPTATLPDTGLTFANASATVASFLFGNRATTIAAGNIDDIRVATNWKDVTGGVTITDQPDNQTVDAGGNAVFSVVAKQTGATYQWKSNGVDLVDGGIVSGATTPSLTLTGVYAAHAASYTVDVIGSNTETSSAATLTVNDPVFTTQPIAAATLVPASTTNLFVVASGTPILTYQWKKNDVNLSDGGSISGATTASLTLSSVSAADDGTYTCAVTNGLGSGIISSNSVISVANDPDVLSQPNSVTNNYSDEAVFTVVASGTPTLSYQWRKNGSNLTDGGNIAGATTASLTIIASGDADEGSYDVIVTNGLSQNVTSAAATLSVNDPIINSQPVSITNSTGTEATFTVVAVGTPVLTYQWRKGVVDLADGGSISGATSATLTISSVATNDAGNYSVVVSNSVGSSATSSTANLTVHAPPVITSAPASRTVNAGVDVSFAVAATTTIGTLSYQWQSNFVDIADATNTVFSLANVQLTDAATYSVVVSNPVGPTTASAVLIVSGGNLRLFSTNLVVLRHGAADQALTTAGNTVSLDQFTTSGDYVSTTVIPDSGADALIVDPSLSTFSGGLSRSADGKELAFSGFNTNRPHSASLTTSSTASAPAIRRAVGKVNGLSLYALAVAHTSFSANSPRGSATDGTNNFWGGGGNQGTRYLGTNSAPVLVSGNGSSTSIRQMKIINNVLYFSTSSTVTAGAGSPLGIWKYTGLPTAVEAPVNVINTLTGSSPGEFALSPGENIMYVADERTTAAGGVQRWTNNAGVWTLEYTITNGIAGLGARGLTVDFSGPDAVIYGTTAEIFNNRLFAVTDTGASSTATILARSGSSQAFRGVEFGPIADVPAIAVQPVSSTNFATTTATFFVTASGTGPFSYQWQKDGVNLNDGGNVSGSTSATLTLSSITGADAANTPGYTVVVTNEIGTVTSVPATLTIAGPPVIVGQPSNVGSVNQGGTATFEVEASGESLSYQWKTNGSPVSGATASSYVWLNAQTSDTTIAFSVEVSNPAGSTNSEDAFILSVTADSDVPKVVVLTPKKNAGTNLAMINVTGTAKDAKPPTGSGIVKAVYLKLNGGATQSAGLTLVTAGSYTWATTNTVELTPGANSLEVWAVDLANNESLHLVHPFYYDSYDTVDIVVNHVNGNVKSGTLGLWSEGTHQTTNVFKVGRSYKLDAFVDAGVAGVVFTNWATTPIEAGSSTNNWVQKASRTFVIQSNMVINVNFMTNPYTLLQGTYNGLFSDTNGVTHETAGFIQVKVKEKSSYSGYLLFDGLKRSFSGKLLTDGTVTKVVSRSKAPAQPDVLLTLAVNLDPNAESVTGSVSATNGAWTSEIIADKAVYSKVGPFDTNNAGSYTVQIPTGVGAPAGSPGGVGYGTVTNSPDGYAKLGGALGEGTKLSQKVSLSRGGNWPLYVGLYKHSTGKDYRGSMQGWVTFNNGEFGPSSSNIVNVIKKENTEATTYYPGGFSNSVELAGSPYVAPNVGVTPITLNVGDAVIVSDGNLAEPMTNLVTFVGPTASGTKVTLSPVTTGGVTNKASFGFKAKDGTFSGGFVIPPSTTKVGTKGVVLQNTNAAAGVFLGTSQSGTVRVE